MLSSFFLLLYTDLLIDNELQISETNKSRIYFKILVKLSNLSFPFYERPSIPFAFPFPCLSFFTFLFFSFPAFSFFTFLLFLPFTAFFLYFLSLFFLSLPFLSLLSFSFSLSLPFHSLLSFSFSLFLFLFFYPFILFFSKLPFPSSCILPFILFDLFRLLPSSSPTPPTPPFPSLQSPSPSKLHSSPSSSPVNLIQ